MMTEETVTFDRTAQLNKLKLDLETATTSAKQSGVALADVILALLQRADELCELADETNVDISRVRGAFEMEQAQ
jgi:hypothetical protein